MQRKTITNWLVQGFNSQVAIDVYMEMAVEAFIQNDIELVWLVDICEGRVELANYPRPIRDKILEAARMSMIQGDSFDSVRFKHLLNVGKPHILEYMGLKCV